jgi:hypothetical protein
MVRQAQEDTMAGRRQTLSLTDQQLRELQVHSAVDVPADDASGEFTVSTFDVGGDWQLLLSGDQHRALLTGTPAVFRFGAAEAVVQRATLPAGPFTLMVTPWEEPADDPTGLYAMEPSEPQRHWDTPNTFEDFGEAIDRADFEQALAGTDEVWVADTNGQEVYRASAEGSRPPFPQSFDLTQGSGQQ